MNRFSARDALAIVVFILFAVGGTAAGYPLGQAAGSDRHRARFDGELEAGCSAEPGGTVARNRMTSVA